MTPISFFTILFSATVFAHTPHDIIYALAAPESLDDSAPWVTMVYHSNFVSEDAGLTWDTTGGEAALFNPVGGGILSDGTIILCSTESVYSSLDGTDWTATTPENTMNVCAVQGNNIILGSNTGVYSGPANGPFERVLSSPAKFLKANNGWLAGITLDSEIIVSTDDNVWLTLPDTGELLASVVPAPTDDGFTVYAGMYSGNVAYWDGSDDWVFCGDLPRMDRPSIVQIDVSSSMVVAGAAEKGPFISEDNCTTWDVDRTTGVVNEFAPISGGANSNEEAVTVLEVYGDRIITAGWAGFYQSDDAGETWRESPLGAGDRAESIAFAPNFSTSGRLYIATLAGGVLVTTDGGASATSPMLGAPGSYVSALSAPPASNGTSPRHLWGIINNQLWFSSDNAVHWTQYETPFDDNFSIANVRAFEKDDLWITSNTPSNDPSFKGTNALSADAGETWQDLEALEETLPMAGFITRINMTEGPTYCAGSVEGAACSDDPLNNWRKLKNVEPRKGKRWYFTHYPDVDPTHILMASNGGEVFLSTDSAETFTKTFDLVSDEWADIVFTENGELFGVTLKGDVYTTQDYTSWSIVAQIPSWPTTIEAHPNFGKSPELVVGTYTGPYMIDFSSGNADVARLGGIERIVAGGGFLSCQNCGVQANVSEPDATLGTAILLKDGIRAHTPVRGHTISIVGKMMHNGTALARIDGIEYPIIGPPSDGFEELLVVSGLKDEYHFVEIEGTPNGNVMFDYVDGISEAHLLTVPLQPVNDTGSDTGDTESEGCGCANQQPILFSWLSFFTLLPLVAYRRRTTFAAKR